MRISGLVLPVSAAALALAGCDGDDAEARYSPEPKPLAGSVTSAVKETDPDSEPPDQASPLEFEPTVFTYEAEPSEKEMTATFKVRNRSDRPIQITKIDTTCTCLSAEADKKEIEPGAESTITAVFDIAKLSGESEKVVIVETNHPDANSTRLAVQVNVPPIVEISPSVVEWVVGEKPTPKEIVFKVLRDKPIRIVSSRSSRRQVTLETKTIEEGREYRLILTPESTEDILLGFVSMETDCELEQHQRKMAYFGIKEPIEDAAND